MQEEIVNKVEKSGLIQFDLADLRTPGERVGIDIKQWLWQGLVLKEKEFRAGINEVDWTLYQEKLVYTFSSEDVIVPVWAYMLIAEKLQNIAKVVVIGDAKSLELQLYQTAIHDMDVLLFKGQRVIVKGCAKFLIPENVYVMFAAKVLPVVKSLMFGEACSAVPVYKEKKG